MMGTEAETETVTANHSQKSRQLDVRSFHLKFIALWDIYNISARKCYPSICTKDNALWQMMRNSMHGLSRTARFMCAPVIVFNTIATLIGMVWPITTNKKPSSIIYQLWFSFLILAPLFASVALALGVFLCVRVCARAYILL